MATCKACNAEIKWIRTAKNKRPMPVDMPAITVVTDLGNMIKAYTPHWVKCPRANQFRKPKSQDRDESSTEGENR